MKHLILLLFVLSTGMAAAQTADPVLLRGLQWRMIGPHRAGRTVGATGVPTQPSVFYIGVNNGGVWKTTDYGRTWEPIFDDQPTGSVGDVAVAPSNPQVLYVASGEGIQRPDLSIGDGVYKSTDGGKTWTNTGIHDGQQIGSIVIDPRNENTVFAAVLGHPYGANAERGVFRTRNGGQSWEKVLYLDENTGAIQVAMDPKNPDILYADLWASRQGPWENGSWQGPGSGLYKTTDGGNTWNRIGKGLPSYEQGLGRIGFCIAPSDPNRLYATVDSPTHGGIYRSDDAGESWYLQNPDPRFWSRGSDFAEVKVDPRNADIVYSANVVMWKSTDGGKTWTGIRGAPGGDDYHRIWINPLQPDIMIFAVDQGAIITVNGGKSYSSWYNQPTAQFYHVSTDNAFPYNVYGGQQESGSVGVASRGNDGQISLRDWHPVGVEEYGYVAADPLDPNIIYGGKITKYDKRTGQTQNIAPEAVRSGKYRFVRTVPVLFSPLDPKALYFCGNVVFKTTTGGASWEVISPDLTREQYDVPANIGVYRNDKMKTMPRRGVIYSLAPSYTDVHTLWAGTDDGLVHVTFDDGKTWKNITPPALQSWSKVAQIDAGRFNKMTAYVAVNAIRLDDMRPHIYKTTDGGATWKEIVQGLPAEPVNTVREDPVRPGLLYAGTERAVYVSFDDGEHWQSLRLNMPATSIRDLVVKDDDLVIGTHGRSFWILDNVTPLRQIAAGTTSQPAVLFTPQTAIRVRWGMYTDTPMPQEEPGGQNPPDGAAIDYYLQQETALVTLKIYDSRQQLVAQFSNQDKPYDIGEQNIPLYWIRPQQMLSGKAGAHRFLWDMHYDRIPETPSYPMSAVYRNTAPYPNAPWVMPGTYTITLTAGETTISKQLTVKMDPRVTTSTSDLQAQHDLSLTCYLIKKELLPVRMEWEGWAKEIDVALARAGAKNKAALEDFLKKGAAIGLDAALSDAEQLYYILHDTDMPPTSQARTGVAQLQQKREAALKAWASFRSTELQKLRKLLRSLR
ncbi:MAG: glycoside hydrolase [Cyclobacteriaceae bacterium]